jgi:hypothetical protein
MPLAAFCLPALLLLLPVVAAVPAEEPPVAPRRARIGQFPCLHKELVPRCAMPGAHLPRTTT